MGFIGDILGPNKLGSNPISQLGAALDRFDRVNALLPKLSQGRHDDQSVLSIQQKFAVLNQEQWAVGKLRLLFEEHSNNANEQSVSAALQNIQFNDEERDILIFLFNEKWSEAVNQQASHAFVQEFLAIEKKLQEYEIYADDSSDEEVEKSIFDTKPSIAKYNEASSKLGAINLHNSFKESIDKDNAKKIVDYFLKLKIEIPDLVTKANAISTSKKVKGQLEKIIPAEEDKSIHNALLAAFKKNEQSTTVPKFVEAIKTQLHIDNAQKKVENYFSQLKGVKQDLITPSKKEISISKSVKNFLEKRNPADEEKPIHTALLKVYEHAEGKTESEFIETITTQWIQDVGGTVGDNANNSVDLKISLICQDLGMRLLIAPTTTKLYFPSKMRLFKSTPDLPKTFDVKALLKQAINETAEHYEIAEEKYQEILGGATFQELVSLLEQDMRKIFYLEKTRAKFQELAQEIEKHRPQGVGEILQMADSVKERHVEKMVDFIAKRAILDSGCIATSSTLKEQFLDEINKKYAYYSQEAREAVSDAFNILKPKKKKETLLESAKKQLKIKIEEAKEGKQGEGEDASVVIYTDLITSFEQKVQEIQEQIERPTLPHATLMSHKNIAQDDSGYSGFQDLCTYLRLINCSTKRFIKNIREKDFDGAEFARAWSFDGKEPFAVIENISLSANKSLSQMVQYPSKSSYNFLLAKLQSFLEQNKNIDGKQAANCIKQILKTGSIGEGIIISKSFENFLTIFTYHLFGTEVQRHPGAAIHHAMAIDLIINGKDWDWVIDHLPMAIETACPVVRCLQVTLSHYLGKPYFYNHQGEKLTHEDVEVQKFILRERELAYTWFEFKTQSRVVAEPQLAALGELCKDFYGIDVVG